MNELSTHRTEASAQANALQFLTFTIKGEEYGIDIMDVREIKGWHDATRLPNSPEYIRGVINLRGLIVPIFDLQARFTGHLTEATPSHVVIIMAIGARSIGILVDSVSDILTVAPEEIRPTPEIESTASSDFITGLISLEERMVVLLQIRHLFAEHEIPTHLV